MRWLLALALTACTSMGEASQALTTACAGVQGVAVTRTAEADWQVCAGHSLGALRYLLAGSGNPGPTDPRHTGAGGVRLRQLDLLRPSGVIVPLMACGNCDTITSTRHPGTSTLAWTGPGYGLESAPLGLALDVDNVRVDLPVGGSAQGSEVVLRSLVTGYSPGEPVTAGSARHPTIGRHAAITINVDKYRWSGELLAWADYELAEEYSGRAEVVSVCTGGAIDRYVAEDHTGYQISTCDAQASNPYTYPVARWVDFLGSDLALRLELDAPTRWRALFNAALPDRKLKAYGWPERHYAAPVLVPRGSVRRYQHTIAVREL